MHWKVLNVTNHQGIANQNHDITSHLLEWLLSKIQEINVDKDVDRREHFWTVSEDANCCSHYGKQYRGLAKNQTQSYHIIQQLHCGAFIWKKHNHFLKKISALPCFFVALFTIVKIQKQPVPLTNEWINKNVLHIYWFYACLTQMIYHTYTYIYACIHI